MQELLFHATVINCVTDENDVLIIGIGNDDVAPDNYVIISKLEEDELEVDDMIHLQTSINRGYYHAIESIIIKQQQIIITILEDMIGKMGFAKAVIGYDVQCIDMNRFFQYIDEIFEGSSVNIINELTGNAEK